MLLHLSQWCCMIMQRGRRRENVLECSEVATSTNFSQYCHSAFYRLSLCISMHHKAVCNAAANDCKKVMSFDLFCHSAVALLSESGVSGPLRKWLKSYESPQWNFLSKLNYFHLKRSIHCVLNIGHVFKPQLAPWTLLSGYRSPVNLRRSDLHVTSV